MRALREDGIAGIDSARTLADAAVNELNAALSSEEKQRLKLYSRNRCLSDGTDARGNARRECGTGKRRRETDFDSN